MSSRTILLIGLVVASCTLLTWGAAVCPNSDAVRPAPAWPSEVGPDLGSAIHADFDGDQKPDIVLGSAVGNSYFLQIRFSTDTPATSLRVSGGVSGIRILSRDVNQDNDEDLIVTSCTSPIPVAVFLGDGKGHFQPGNPWNFIPVGINSPCRYAPTTGHASAIGDSQQRRLPSGGLCGVFTPLKLRDKGSAACRAARSTTAPDCFGCVPRGPPIDSIL